MKHYTRICLNERIVIQSELVKCTSLGNIAKLIHKSTSSISREICSHRIVSYSFGSCYAHNRCIHRFDCEYTGVCTAMKYICKSRKCKSCKKNRCNLTCKDYQEEHCLLLSKPPYVCNGCDRKHKCSLVKQFYKAKEADDTYCSLRSESRSGLNMTELELKELDDLISPRILLGQSIHHILTSSSSVFTISEKQVYRLVHSGLITAKPIDMPRVVRMKPRKKKSTELKVDKKCRIKRTYEDYKAYMEAHPDEAVLQGDTVEGVKGGKCILTLTWVQWSFQLGFLRDHNNSASVTAIVDHFYSILGAVLFQKIFPSVWLLDNGSEFSDPASIEKYGIHVFYCDPSAPYQKGTCENNHEHIRRVCPKGTSFDCLTQEFFDLLFSHINSFNRKKLNNRCPYDLFSSLFGADISIQDVFHSKMIHPEDVNLTPSLLRSFLSSHQIEKEEN